MASSHSRSNRKPSGSRYKNLSKKKRHELAGEPTLTLLGSAVRKMLRIRGGNEKQKVLQDEFANVYNPKTKKSSKVKIETVVDNPANRQYIRRNIITKGTIIKTSAGNARVTSRPGQEGTVNAILIEK